MVISNIKLDSKVNYPSHRVGIENNLLPLVEDPAFPLLLPLQPGDDHVLSNLGALLRGGDLFIPAGD